ncbi:unnamed protein product [Paramecium pentaurelia]|uniref:Uncharacterized protein n=1 Tax=Paramecium pentaurelia TaxID=43138 RepID=A0A8S1SPB9_9CILI|nr:unnamed protein product [Paramecium pentaurelia]
MDQKSPQKQSSPIKISINNIDKISYSIKDSWKNQQEENQKLFDQFLQYCKSQYPVFNIKFTCSISGEWLEQPVSFMQCIIEKKHLNDCFDLRQILKYLIQNDSNFMQDGYIQCPLCRAKSHFKKDIPLIPNLFFQQLQQQLNDKSKPITYYLSTQILIPLYPGFLGKEQFKYNNQIQQIFSQQNDTQQNFTTIRKQTKGNESFKYYHLCQLGNMRIQIPVRGKQCNHLECYDFLYLNWYMQQRDQKQFKCLFLGCQEIINLNELQLDQELYEIGLKSYNFSSDFIFERQSLTLLDTYSITNYDPQIVAYKKLVPTTTETMNYIKSIYDLTDRIYSSTKNQELTDKFYEHPLNGDLNIIKDQITNCKIEIPCRCIRCDKVNVCDLRYMSCILNQVQHPENRNGVKTYSVSCPLCHNPFSPKKRHRDQSVHEQVYVDTKMLNFINTIKNFNFLNKEKYQLFLQNKLYPSLRFEELESPIQELDQFNLKLRCLITNQKLRNPIRGIYCQHPEAFDENSLTDLCSTGQLDLNLAQCPQCQQSIHKLTHDNILKELIGQLQGDFEEVQVFPKLKSIKQLK